MADALPTYTIEECSCMLSNGACLGVGVLVGLTLYYLFLDPTGYITFD
jgi:hypothetical protein